MSISNAQMNWARARARGTPCFVTDNVVCIPSKNFVSFCDANGTRLGSRPCPGGGVQCVAVLTSRGVVAIGCKRGVTVLSYPDLRTVSTLGQCEGCKALLFVAQDHLAVAKENGGVELWEWKTGRRAWFVRELLPLEELRACHLSVSPTGRSEVCLQSGSRFLFMGTDAESRLRTRSVFLYQSEDGSFKAECEMEHGCLSLTCHCWLREEEDCVLVHTSAGLLKLDTDGLRVWGLTLPRPESSITSMTLKGNTLVLGHEDGIVDVLDFDKWTSLKTIDVGGPISDISFSHRSEMLLFTTSRGAISSYHRGFLNEIVPVDSSETIGVCVVDRHCAIARRDGTVTVLMTEDGSEVGFTNLFEQFTCAASSPLCSLLVAGCRSGFIHFIDVVRSRVVHCVKAHESSVSLLQFDRFGRFLMTSSSQNHDVHIYSGLPSKRFQFLGSVRVPNEVKGMAVSGSVEEETTSLFLLSESGRGSEHGAGNVLVRVDLPSDLSSCPGRYHSDDFGNLCLSVQTFRLSHPSARLNVHSSLGAVLFHSPIVGQVQRLPVDFERATPKQSNLFKAEEVSLMKVSPSERWLATVDCSGLIRIYSTTDFKTPAFVQTPLFEEGVRFFEFSAWDDAMVMADEHGNVACFKWETESPSSKVVTEWTFFCHSNSKTENEALRGTSEEEEDPRCIEGSSSTLEELGHEFDKHLDIVNFELIRLPTERLEKDSYWVFDVRVSDDGTLKTLSDCNCRIFLDCGGPEDDNVTRNGDETLEAKCINSPSAIFVQSYPGIPPQSKGCKSSSGASRSAFRSKGIQIENKNLRFEFVKDIRNEIRDWKMEFNAFFDVLRSKDIGLKNRVSDMSYKLKVLTSNLPSKGERDLWSALYQDNGPNLPKTSSTDQDSVSDTKRAIESLSESVANVEKDFDADMQRWRLKKLLCDFAIHVRELKVLCVLLYSLAEQEITQHTNEIRHGLGDLESFESVFERMLEEVRDLEREYGSCFTRVLQLRRTLDSKVQMKLNKPESKCVYDAYKAKPASGKDSLDLSEDLAHCEQHDPAATFRTDEQNAAWKSISKYRSRRVSYEIVLKHVHFQISELTKLRIQCEEERAKTAAKRRLFSRVSVGLANLLAKLKETVCVVLSVNLPMSEDGVDLGRRGVEVLQDVLPKEDDPFWNKIRIETVVNVFIQHGLLELEKSLRDLFQFQVYMNSRMSESRGDGDVEECKCRLRGAKGVFTDINDVMAKIL